MDFEGGFIDPTSTAASVRALSKAVADNVSSEVKKCNIVDVRSGTSSGSIAGSMAALSSGDDTVALPEVLPIKTLLWPEAVLAEWQAFKAYSCVGIFSSISRAYIVADNKLLLWNFATGKEFLSFNEIPELITCLSDPVKPKQGVFQPHITQVIVCATPRCVYIIGVSMVGDDPRTSEMRLFHLNYVVEAPCIVVKFAVHEGTGRIFCAGADGNTYEIEYSKDQTVYQARMKFVNHSVAFGRIPVLSTVGHALREIKQMMTHAQPSLRDICVDQQRNLLFTLAADGVLAMWKLAEHGGLERQATTKHQLNVIVKTLHSNIPPQLSPLVAIFPIRSDRGYSLASVAANGDVYRYACSDGGWGSSSYLDVRERSSYNLMQRHSGDISVCWSANGVLIFAAQSATEEADLLSFVHTPIYMLPPHQHIREVVSTFEKASSGATRIDAVGECWAPQHSVAANTTDVVSQMFCAPREFACAHRHGISIFMKLRPVDMLHCVFLNGDVTRRDQLLKRFQTVFSAVDYCCMLLQLASGSTTHPHTSVDHSVTRGINASGSHPSQRLGTALLQPVSHEVQRLARDVLLRSYMMPTWSDSPHSSTTHRYIAVNMSVLTQSIAASLARSLLPVWDVSIWKIEGAVLRSSETLLAELRRQMDLMKSELWPDCPLGGGFSVLWDSGKATLRILPHGPMNVTPQDVRSLQTSYVSGLATLIESASQTIRFLKLLGGISVLREEVRFGELVSSTDRSQALAKAIGRQIVSDGPKRREYSRVFSKMQLECPQMFADVDVAEFQVRIEIDRMGSTAPHQMKLWGPDRIREFEASVEPNASALWSNGSLQVICEELRALRREDSAVKLLLHASHQMHGQASQRFSLGQLYGTAGDVAHLNQKQKILQLVVVFLESAWEQNRPVAETLLGMKDKPGMIWAVEPTDEAAHCFLFDWFLSPRESSIIQKQLEDTVLMCRSPFLAGYLERCSASGSCAVSKHYAKYLRAVRKDYKNAVSVLSRMAQSPLFQVGPYDRLQQRLECWKEALDCAVEGRLSSEEQEIERRVKLTTAQVQLADALRQSVDRGSVQLQDKLTATLSTQLDENDMMLLAEDVREFGGGEVQLAVLAAFSNIHPSMYMSAVESCFNRSHGNASYVAETILKKYGKQPSFPIGLVLKYLERFSYDACNGREGSPLCVDLLCECGLELHVVFAHYAEIIERREVPWSGINPLQNVVPDSFLCYSVALLVKKMVASPQLRANASFTAPIVHSARNLVAQVAAKCRAGERIQRNALDHAERMLDQCQASLRHVV
ncbi:nucleoporin, putative [Bodo saltans]|uniref:Nucleoporin, putative n=1 Tax=Bodo saltans TaxID=75058 RepID=A0A0S4KJK5_BODSA|nr:nucleoporin, putative [Bodo saltans]|eukprot:CUI15347.1 nucleoporin, putative [Bodo saltans]